MAKEKHVSDKNLHNRKLAGRWIKEKRQELELTQLQLMKLVGYEYPSFIGGIEQGVQRIPPEKYRDFAIALKMDPAEFMKRLLMYYDPHAWALLFGKGRLPSEVEV